MVGRAMLALWPWGSYKSMEITMMVAITTDLKADSFEGATREIRDYIASHSFGERLYFSETCESVLIFEEDQGLFLASAHRVPVAGVYGYIRDIVR
jgi:hypothetical protein